MNCTTARSSAPRSPCGGACWRIVDAGLIDGAVNGAGRAARLLGWAGGQLQTGRVTTYLVAFMLGALLVLGVLS